MSWDDCQVFLAKLDAMVPGLLARLPSEAEWEYACRGGTTTSTWRGDLDIHGTVDAPILGAIAWYGGNSGESHERETHPVGRKQPNPHGLFDMLGNVSEWCQDWQGPYGKGPAVDPTGPGVGSSRVYRGGSWRSHAGNVRAAFRNAVDPGYRGDDLGFRIAGGSRLLR